MTVDRRAFLKAGGLALVTLGAGPSFLHRAARAVAAPGAHQRRKVLVTLFQRGAMDGLMAVSPVSAPELAKLRPRLALSAARGGDLLDLGVGYALHPALKPLLEPWREGRLAVVHGVGSPDPTRSHFDAQDYMETGTPGRKGTSSGWLNRASGLLGHDATPFRAVSLTSALPRSLYGDEPAVAVRRLEDFRLRSGGLMAGGVPGGAGTGQDLEALYRQTAQDLLRDTGGETFEALDLLQRVPLRGYRPAGGARYPRSPLGESLRQIAMLIKADVGLEVAFAESGGWDTHVAQGTVNGSFARHARDLADSIAAFWTDLGGRRDDVVVLTMTEFGRTVAENGAAGTDHGHGSCLFVLGNQVDGGKVHGELGPLAPDNLYEGRDLPVTTDFRSVFSEVAGAHLGVPVGEELFPGWSGSRLPLFRRG
ncbi:MAG: DUF1501 domain-containing protein [Acidobacteriota bacterium]|nr:DUF1501 domain-containing protein [Acidobacteriota bacterium]